MAVPRMPTGFGAGGKLLWKAIAHEGMGEHHVALLTEACRARDRLDRLDRLLRGDADTWARLVHRTQTNDYELRIDAALAQANTTAGVLTNLLGKLPAPKPATKGSTGGNSNSGATPIDRARSRRGAGGGAKPTRTRTAERRRRTGE